jgi:hypothetical protein
MSKFSMLFGGNIQTPEPPPLPPLPPLPTEQEPEIDEADKRALQVAAARKGIQSTIKTSGLGDTSEPVTKRPTLLGQGAV